MYFHSPAIISCWVHSLLIEFFVIRCISKLKKLDPAPQQYRLLILVSQGFEASFTGQGQDAPTTCVLYVLIKLLSAIDMGSSALTNSDAIIWFFTHQVYAGNKPSSNLCLYNKGGLIALECGKTLSFLLLFTTMFGFGVIYHNH